MSLNESTDGSLSASTAARLLSLKLKDVESYSKLSGLWSHQMAQLAKLLWIKPYVWEEYLSRQLKHDASLVAFFGLHSLTEENWMKSILESIGTPARAVDAFRKINARVAFYKDNEAGVSAALLPFCQMLVDGGILELLGLLPRVPADILSITTRFLVESRQLSSPSRVLLIDSLLRKNMLIDLLPTTITEGSIRGFIWKESQHRKRTKNMPAEANPAKSWTAESYLKTGDNGKKIGEPVEIDGTGGQITISKFVLPSANLEGYAWEVASSKVGYSGRIFGYGFSETLEQAAEDAYLSFYKTVTYLAFQSACAFTNGKEIILIGTELSSEEFLKGAGKAKSYYFLVQMPQSEDRDGTLFCLNWHTINKVKRTFKIEKVSGKVLTLEGGTKIDVDTVMCYVKCPEQYINTEVRCMKCGRLQFPGMVGGRYIQGVGYQCGPSLDNSVDNAELSDSQFD